MNVIMRYVLDDIALRSYSEIAGIVVNLDWSML